MVPPDPFPLLAVLCWQPQQPVPQVSFGPVGISPALSKILLIFPLVPELLDNPILPVWREESFYFLMFILSPDVKLLTCPSAVEYKCFRKLLKSPKSLDCCISNLFIPALDNSMGPPAKTLNRRGNVCTCAAVAEEQSCCPET